jgi:signal transduction histidine kinase
VAVLVASVAVAATLASLEPLLAAQAEELAELSGDGQAVARLRLSTRLVFALDALLSAVITYLALRFAFSRPLDSARAEVAPMLREVGLRMSEGGPPEQLFVTDIRRLVETIKSERLVSARRLTELEVNAEQKARLQGELVAADRLATVGKLAAGVAHEVGNPLSGVLGYLSVLRMRAGAQPEVLDPVERIEAEVRRIDDIVRGLLEMGRPSRGKAQPIDVVPVVESCVRMVRAMREYEGVTLEVQCPAAAWMRAESGPLSQVLVNLLLNAAQAMGGQGRVEIIVEPKGAGGEIRVLDEGPGLGPEVLSRLFTPFFTTKPPGKGTGLGLAVSRHLLAQFEGGLVARNRDGRGAVFTVTLPG